MGTTFNQAMHCPSHFPCLPPTSTCCHPGKKIESKLSQQKIDVFHNILHPLFASNQWKLTMSYEVSRPGNKIDNKTIICKTKKWVYFIYSLKLNAFGLTLTRRTCMRCDRPSCRSSFPPTLTCHPAKKSTENSQTAKMCVFHKTFHPLLPSNQ